MGDYTMNGTKRFSVTVEWLTWPMQYEPRTHRQTLVCCDKTTMGEILEWARNFDPEARIYDLKFSDVGTFDDGGL